MTPKEFEPDWSKRDSPQYRNQIVEHYMPLVTRLALKWKDPEKREEATQNGHLALIRAVELFDESKSDNFERYAAKCISLTMTTGWHDSKLIKVPRNSLLGYNKQEKFKEQAEFIARNQPRSTSMEDGEQLDLLQPGEESPVNNAVYREAMDKLALMDKNHQRAFNWAARGIPIDDISRVFGVSKRKLRKILKMIAVHIGIGEPNEPD